MTAALGRAGALVRLCWQAGRGRTAGGALLTAVSGLAPSLAALSLKAAVDGLSDGGGVAGHDITLAIAGLGLSTLITAILPQLTQHLQEELNRRIYRLAQDRLYRAVNGFDGLVRLENPRFLDRLRLAEQAAASLAPATACLFGLLRDAVALTGLVVAVAVLSPLMALVVLLAAAPAVAVQLSLSRRQVALLAETSPATRRGMFFSSLLVDLRAAKEVRLLGLGGFLRRRMLAELTSVQRRERQAAEHALRMHVALAALGAVLAVGGLVWAVRSAAAGRLTIGEVSVFLAVLAALQAAIAGAVGSIASLSEVLALFGSYTDVTTAANDLVVSPDPRSAQPLCDAVEIRDVWFRYAPDQPWVLRGVNLTLPRGSVVALVGLNGAGKSTLVKLLCRFYDPDRGSIRWDGVDVREMPVADLRQRIGVLFQDFMCYDLTAAENIGFGDLGALHDRDRIVDAARRAGVDRAVERLPRGYDTLLSRIFSDPDGDDTDAGAGLSGGQWQRLALARTLLRSDRDLLILDEPSAGLDAEAEHAVHERLRTHRAGTTSVLISHRLSAVRRADAIVVLAHGRIVEHGTHAELMTLGGRYARLFELQANGYVDPPGVDRLTAAPTG